MTGPQGHNAQGHNEQAQQNQSQHDFGGQGFGPQGYAPAQPPRQKSQVGPRLMAFATRDVPALVAAVITVVMGLLLLVTPRLAWLKDSSFDIVEGTMTFSARGTVDLSATAQRGLSNSDALEVGFVEIMLQSLLAPLAGMLTLSAVLVLIGGLLMITTARQLGAVVAIIGVVPQIFITLVGMLIVVITDDSSPSPGPSGISAGAGVYLTLVAYVIVILCAALAALRRERPRQPAPSAAPTTGAASGPATGPNAHYPAPPQQPQQYGPEGQPPTGS